jgi:recombination protein RecT
MIRGLYKLARNSGEVASLSAHVVHAKDEFFYAYGFDIDLKHVPHMGEDRGDAIAVYAAVVLKDGSRDLEVMSVSDVEKVRSVSKTGKSGPWVQWWDEMARKTVMRRMLKRVPMSEDVERAIERDNAFYEMERRRNEPPAIQGPANTAEVIDYGTEAGWGSTAIDHDHETGEIQSEGDDGDQEEDATGEPEAEETSEPEQQEEGAAVSTPTADKPQATKAKPAAAKGGANSNLFPE